MLGLLQDLNTGHVPVDEDSAPFASTIEGSVRCLSDFVTGSVRISVGGTVELIFALEHVPAGGLNQEISKASQGEPLLMDKLVDTSDLPDVEICIQSVICCWIPEWFDEPLFLVFPYSLLRKIDTLGHLIDKTSLHFLGRSTHRLFQAASSCVVMLQAKEGRYLLQPSKQSILVQEKTPRHLTSAHTKVLPLITSPCPPPVNHVWREVLIC